MLGALIPWAITYEAVKLLGLPPDAFETRFSWEWNIPVLPASMPIYASVYLIVPLTFLLCTQRAELRRLMAASWLAVFLNTLIYLTIASHCGVPYRRASRLDVSVASMGAVARHARLGLISIVSRYMGRVVRRRNWREESCAMPPSFRGYGAWC